MYPLQRAYRAITGGTHSPTLVIGGDESRHRCRGAGEEIRRRPRGCRWSGRRGSARSPGPTARQFPGLSADAIAISRSAPIHPPI